MNTIWHSGRVLLLGLAAMLLVVGLALVVLSLGQHPQLAERPARVDALASSRDTCVTCHRDESPGIVHQYSYSSMAAAEVTCRSCHEVPADYPAAVAHEGTFVLQSPTPKRCEQCHTAQVAQFNQSRHGLPAYVAYAGAERLSPELLALYESIPEGTYAPNQLRNALYELQGEAIGRFACEGCHNIGQPRADGSVGQCTDCHLRHTFSLEQARKPETCNRCHIGPDHPQWEIYQESPHGIAYMTMGHTWNWEADPGTLTVVDMPAATCATCHISGFGATAGSHDVGERLAWYLFAPISTHRPAWEANRARMQGVCSACHNPRFVTDFYTAADAATLQVNAWVVESDEIIQPLKDAGLLTEEPFDQTIDYVHYELWHHWGRTAKFGVWMLGPDYVQWHGAYEVLRSMTELRELTEALQHAAPEP